MLFVGLPGAHLPASGDSLSRYLAHKSMSVPISRFCALICITGSSFCLGSRVKQLILSLFLLAGEICGKLASGLVRAYCSLLNLQT